jgi:ADP-ribose pyrophosphatase
VRLEKKLDEETQSSSILYRGRIVNVRQDQVLLPGGETAFREVVEHPGAAAALALDDQERVILVRQYRQPAAAVLLEIPAGKLDPGEEPLACAQRELAEETGFRGNSWRPLGWFYLSPGFCNEKIHLFLARELTVADPLPTVDLEETVEVISLPLGELYEMAAKGELKDAKTVIALYLARAVTA